jgi:hypothetical protein
VILDLIRTVDCCLLCRETVNRTLAKKLLRMLSALHLYKVGLCYLLRVLFSVESEMLRYCV